MKPQKPVAFIRISNVVSIRTCLSFVLEKLHHHYQDFSFLLIYAIYLLILAGFPSPLLLLDYLRPYYTALHRLCSPSLLNCTSWLCPQTDQELSLQFSVSQIRGCGCCSQHVSCAQQQNEEVLTAFHTALSSPQSWNVSLYFFIRSVPVINIPLSINTYHFLLQSFHSSSCTLTKEHSFFAECPTDQY